jgi:diamine N-acetyltransferase
LSALAIEVTYMTNNLSVTLRPVTRENFEACCDLEVAEKQLDFVSSNVFSLAESKFYPEFIPLAIYGGDTMVGFLMYGRDDLDGELVWTLLRLMVDRRYQRKGYGRAALELFIEQMRMKPGCKALHATVIPGNDIAQSLYASLGFVETGDMEDGDLILRFRNRERRRA